MKKLTNMELMLVVMRADEQLQGVCIRGTTNWAAAIGKAVQDSILVKQTTSQTELLPMQPIHITDSGIARFKKNRMVDDMYEFSQTNGFGLNEMSRRDYAQEERMQFAQLIGYSVSGYGTLSYASSESVEKANAIANLLLTNKDQP